MHSNIISRVYDDPPNLSQKLVLYTDIGQLVFVLGRNFIFQETLREFVFFKPLSSKYYKCVAKDELGINAFQKRRESEGN